MRKLEEKRGRYIWAGAAILILMVVAGVFGLSLHAQARAVPVNPIDGLNTGRSQELIVGTGFSMDKKQQQIHKKEEKIRKAQQQKQEQKVAASSPRQVHKEGNGQASPESGDSGGPNTDAGETEEGDAEKPDETEEAIAACAKEIAAEFDYGTNMRGSAEYRQHLAEVLLRRSISSILTEDK